MNLSILLQKVKALAYPIVQVYSGLSSRDKVLVKSVSIFLLLFVLLFGLLFPQQKKVDQLQNAIRELSLQAKEAELLASTLQKQDVRKGAKQPLLASVEKYANQTNVRSSITHIKPMALNGEKGLSVRMRDVSYSRLISFLEKLAHSRIAVIHSRILFGGKPGFVHVELSLRD